MRDSDSDLRYAGAAAENLVVARLLARGHNAWIPAIDSGADIGVCVGSRLVRIQVKCSSTSDRKGKAGSKRFWLQRVSSKARGRKTTYESCDEALEIFALVAMPEQVVFVVPYADVAEQHSVTMRCDDERREAWHLIDQYMSLSDVLVRTSDSEIKTVEPKDRLPICRSG